MADVFISYSRKNSDFARRLIDRLTLAGKDAWVDWEGIPLTSPNWWAEIRAGIQAADNFLFILTPDSMASVVCNLELDYAIELRKRIVPVVYQDVATRDAFASIADFTPDEAMQERLAGKDPLLVARENWQRLSHINWLFFRDEDDFDTAFDRLITTVETDLDYVKAHTRYLVRAEEWQREQQRADLLLFGAEIDRAEGWLVKGEGYAAAAEQSAANPLPGDLHREYIRVSRVAERRRRRLVLSAQLSIVVLVLALAAGLLLGSSIVTQTQQEAADIQSTSAENVALAATQAAAAEQREADAVTAVALANSQLTAVPPTLTQVNQQVLDAQGQADSAGTQVAEANSELATATQALVTATHIAEQAAAGQATLGAVSTQVIVIEATVTQAAVVQRITDGFADALLWHRDNPDAQIAVMDALIAEFPEESFAWYSRGVIRRALGNQELALADYSEAIRINPGYAAAYYNRGNVRYVLEDLEGALADYSEAIRINPGYAEAYNNRGGIRYVLGDLEGALVDYSEAIRLAPNLAEAYNNRGLAKSALGDLEGAIADWSETIRLNPDLAITYLNRGIAHQSIGNESEAAEDYYRWMQLNQTIGIVGQPLEPNITLELVMQTGGVYSIPLSVATGATITITAEGQPPDTIDPLIVLLAAGQPVTGDDDSLNRMDAMLHNYTLHEPGPYTLVVGYAGGGSEGIILVTLILE